MNSLNEVLIQFVLEGPNHIGPMPVTIKIEASRMDGALLLDTIRGILYGPASTPEKKAAAPPEPVTMQQAVDAMAIPLKVQKITRTKPGIQVDANPEDSTQYSAEGQKAMDAAIAAAGVVPQHGMPSTKDLPTLKADQLVRYVNPKKPFISGFTGTVVKHRGAMVLVNFGAKGDMWVGRHFCSATTGPEAGTP